MLNKVRGPLVSLVFLGSSLSHAIEIEPEPVGRFGAHPDGGSGGGSGPELLLGYGILLTLAFILGFLVFCLTGYFLFHIGRMIVGKENEAKAESFAGTSSGIITALLAIAFLYNFWDSLGDWAGNIGVVAMVACFAFFLVALLVAGWGWVRDRFR